MSNRLGLQTLLEGVLESRNVYFQPPTSIKMKYPAIVYNVDSISSFYADDGVYLFKRRYNITVIDADPDSSIVDKVLLLPTCKFVRSFQSDNLNHNVFTIHY